MIALMLAMALSQPTPAEVAIESLAGQGRAWNTGDLEGALGAYCPRPDIVWVNRSGISRGFEQFASSMRTEFRDPGRMGRMTIEVLDSRPISPESALVTLRWEIARDGRRLMGGVSTQLWSPCEGRLRIVLEHAS